MGFSLRLDTSSCDLVMMLPQCSHITRKRGVYYYRRRLPQHPTRELTLSLRTRSFREAQWLAATLDREFRKLMSSMKKYEKPEDIQGIARDYLKGALETDLWERQARAGQSLTGWFHWALSFEFADEQLDKAQGELSGRGNPERHGELVDWLMDRHGVPEDQRKELFFAILRAHVAQWETIRHRALGNFNYTPPDLDEERPPQSNGVTVLPAAAGPLLSEVLPSFLDFMSQNEEWRGQTLEQNTTTYEMFKECCGDLPVTTYERKHLAAFYDLLRGLPRLYSKSAAWRGLSLAEVVARTKDEEHERLAMKTIKRHFSALGVLFAYLKQRGEYVGENPAYGFRFPDKGRTRDKRSMWEGESLAKLFSSPVWTGCYSEGRRSRPGKIIIKDEKYWLPLLGVYHGNRLEEFAQLERADVKEEDGIWFLDINDEGEKQVKNEQSKRRVPLHPELQRLGFLEYVEKLAPNPTDRLFPALQPGGPDQKLGYSFTKWWSRYRKDIGVYQKGLDYHSFRAGVATKLAEANISLEVRNELLGHEGKSTDERNYQKGFSLKFLAEAISKVSWPEVRL
jgi:site-specific recombinase XerD